MKIAVYSGNETVYVEDIENFLRKEKISYDKIDRNDIFEDKLKNYSALIIPGGHTPKCVEELKPLFFKIRKFVADGGMYIGICMGSYLAADKVSIKDVVGYNPEGLGIIDIKVDRSEGIGNRGVILTKNNEKIRVFCQNPPLFIVGKDVNVLASYDERYAAWVYSKYKKGKVILFSFHPEKRKETFNLLKDAVFLKC